MCKRLTCGNGIIVTVSGVAEIEKVVGKVAVVSGPYPQRKVATATEIVTGDRRARHQGFPETSKRVAPTDRKRPGSRRGTPDSWNADAA
jgi:hypothetical protein